MNTTRRNASRGVSAVEVMVATVILAVGLVPVLTMQVRGTKQAGFSRGHAIAALYARAVLDALSARGADDLAQAASAGPLATPDVPAPQGVQVQKPVVDVSVDADAGVVVASVSVAWSAGSDPVEHRVRCSRILCRRDASWSETTALPAVGSRVAD